MGMEIGAILFEITRIIGFLRTLLIRLEMENSFACRCQTGITAFITLIDLEIAVFRREQLIHTVFTQSRQFMV